VHVHNRSIEFVHNIVSLVVLDAFLVAGTRSLLGGVAHITHVRTVLKNVLHIHFCEGIVESLNIFLFEGPAHCTASLAALRRILLLLQSLQCLIERVVISMHRSIKCASTNKRYQFIWLFRLPRFATRSLIQQQYLVGHVLVVAGLLAAGANDVALGALLLPGGGFLLVVGL